MLPTTTIRDPLIDSDNYLTRLMTWDGQNGLVHIIYVTRFAEEMDGKLITHLSNTRWATYKTLFANTISEVR